jgi:hypothetical protein
MNQYGKLAETADAKNANPTASSNKYAPKYSTSRLKAKRPLQERNGTF